MKVVDVTGTNPSHLFIIIDCGSRLRYLIQKRAQVSIIPPSAKEWISPSTLTLQAVNNTSIHTYGSCSLTLNLGMQRTFQWVFVVADVTNAILGADFCSATA